MIEIDEETVDKAIDDILGTDEHVRGKLCPACKRKRISEGQKARQARERQERDAASVGAGTARPDENRTNLYPSDELLAKWEALKEAEDTSSAPPEPEPPEPPEREPEDWSEDELRGKLAKGLKKDAGDVVRALYECIRDVARTAGIQTRIVLESMYELDTVLSHIGGV